MPKTPAAAQNTAQQADWRIQERISRTACSADSDLVQRCLMRALGAWDELYRQYQSVLVSTAINALGTRLDGLLVSDEIAARVWYQLIANDSELLKRFDPAQGSLRNYLASICRNQVRNYRKWEKRLRAREVNGDLDLELRGKCHRDPQGPCVIPLEFLARLTPREKQFLDSQLLASDNSPDQKSVTRNFYSAANERQVRCRIRRKLIRFLGAENVT